MSYPQPMEDVQLMDDDDFLQEGQRPIFLDRDELLRVYDSQLDPHDRMEHEGESDSLDTEQDLVQNFEMNCNEVRVEDMLSMCSGGFEAEPEDLMDYSESLDTEVGRGYDGDVSMDDSDGCLFSSNPFRASNYDADAEMTPIQEITDLSGDIFENVSYQEPMSVGDLDLTPFDRRSDVEMIESPDIFSNVTQQTPMSPSDLFEDESSENTEGDGDEGSASSEKETTVDQTGGSRKQFSEEEEEAEEHEVEDEQLVETETGETVENGTLDSNVNIRDLYQVTEFSRDYWKRSWARRGYRLTFKPEFAHLIVDNHELYATAILDLAARLTNGHKEVSLGIGIDVNNDQEEMFHIPYQKISKYTTQFLLNEINDRIQSARGVTPITKDMLNVELTFIDHLRGSGLSLFRPKTKDILNALKDCTDLFEQELRSITRKRKPTRRRKRDDFIDDEVDESDAGTEEEESEEEEAGSMESEQGSPELPANNNNNNNKHSCHVYKCGEEDLDDDSDEEDTAGSVNTSDDEEDSEERKAARQSSVKGLLKENNVFSDCLATAFLQGKAYCDYRAGRCSQAVYKSYARVNDSHPARSRVQRQEARDLLTAAGISKRRNFTMKDVRKLQRHVLKSYQIVVMGSAFDTQPLYTGTFCGHDRVVGLLLEHEHFQHILQLPRFMGTKFWCSLCNARNSCSKRHYRCPLKCQKCLSEVCKTETPLEGDGIKCENCNVIFVSQGCYDRHLDKGVRNGKSRCEETKVCKKCDRFYYTGRGLTHFCGEAYCRQCKCLKKANHRHTLAVSKPNEKKKKPFRRIFFDLETYVVDDENGRKVHRVCLAQALRCCPDCNDQIPESLDEARELTCETCSKDEPRFFEFGNIDEGDENEDVLKRFGDWLINRRHRGFSVIAHNLKGFDGQLLLEYVIKESTRVPEPKHVILAGRKLNFMEICGVKFLDSFNYIHAALKKFSAAFDVPEIKKGEFPHKFVTPENFSYVGPMPGKEFYDYERRTKDGKAEFDAFYDPLVERGHVFHFAEEMKQYCFSDVALLAAGMVKFEAAFKEETNVILFEETVTAAGAAIKTFQRNYLKPYSMVLDVDPSGSKINQSALAGRYLSYLQKWEGYPFIQNKFNIGEFKTPSGHYVDGYIEDCEEYPGGLIIEINGCFNHAHSCSYSDESLMRGGERAKDIRARDAKRLLDLEQFCRVIVVWECEIRTDAQYNRFLAQHLEKNMDYGPIVMKEVLFGGRTEPIRLKQDVPEDLTGYYVDFISLYPTCMKFDKYPVGEPEYLHGSMFDPLLPLENADVLRGTCKGVISCKVLAPDQLFFPVLPYRSNAKLYFSLCKACTDKAANSEETTVHDTLPGCNHCEDERAFYGTWTHVELTVALEMGYQILEVYGAISWRRWSQYYKNGDDVEHGLFSEYVDAFTKGKLEASGPPRWVTNDEELDQYVSDVNRREGILLDKEKIKKDETRKQMFKLLLNSLWGKFGQRVDVKKTFIVKTASKFHKIFEDPHLRVCTVDRIADTLVVVAQSVSGAAEPLSTSAMPYAVFTTSHARVRLYRLLQTIPDPEKNVFYMDTDSLIYMSESCPHPELMGDTLGQLKNELIPGARLEKWVTTGPKSYAIQQRLPDGGIKLELKCKGFPKTGESEKKLDFSLMDRMVSGVLNGENGIYKEINYFSIQRDRNHVLFNTEIAKKFKFTFKKRTILKDGGTYPLGYKTD